MIDLFVRKAAVLSDCKRYRYSLERAWDPSLQSLCWVMLNPSTADAEQDDPTVRRVVGFSAAWGYGGVTVVNLFALRAADPVELYTAADPVGPLNDLHLEALAGRDRRVLAAWGVHGSLYGRGGAVLAAFAQRGVEVGCLGVTRGGQPKHPLYLKGDTAPEVYQAAGGR